MGRQPWQYVKARLAEELDVYDALLAKSGAYLTGATVTLPDCFLWATIEQARTPVVMPAPHLHGTLVCAPMRTSSVSQGTENELDASRLG